MSARITLPSPRRAIVTVVALMSVSCGETPLEPVSVRPVSGLQGFEAQLDSIRVALRIPGMAAAIAQDGEIVWSRGFGFADVEGGRPATDTTAFYWASVTKSVAAIVLMQLVEEGRVNLDAPMSDYGVTLEADGEVAVRHVFNHTSEGIPGSQFRYNGGRYIQLPSGLYRPKTTGRQPSYRL